MALSVWAELLLGTAHWFRLAFSALLFPIARLMARMPAGPIDDSNLARSRPRLAHWRSFVSALAAIFLALLAGVDLFTLNFPRQISPPLFMSVRIAASSLLSFVFCLHAVIYFKRDLVCRTSSLSGDETALLTVVSVAALALGFFLSVGCLLGVFGRL